MLRQWMFAATMPAKIPIGVTGASNIEQRRKAMVGRPIRKAAMKPAGLEHEQRHHKILVPVMDAKFSSGGSPARDVRALSPRTERAYGNVLVLQVRVGQGKTLGAAQPQANDCGEVNLFIASSVLRHAALTVATSSHARKSH
jgi:hypothetical protein